MIRRLFLSMPLLALALLLSPAPALGAANHPFLGAITGSPTEYEAACGLAFAPGGALYVSDYHHDSIVGPTTIAAEDPGDGPCKLAFDSEGNLYVNNYHRDVVKYTEPFSVGTGVVIDPELPTTEQPTGLAVDPATGDLYVAHRTYVAEYKAPVEPEEVPVKIGLGSLEEGYGVAVSDFPATAGYIYVPDAKDNTVKVFNPAGSLVEVMNGSATPQGSFKYLIDSEVAVDNSPTSPSYGHVFVLDAIGHGLSEHPEAVLDEFNAAGDYRGQVTGFTDAEPSGIAFQEGTHNVYVTSGNSEDSAVFVYGPTAPAHTLKVAKTGAGGGTVTSSPVGIDCGEACAAEYNEGQLVTLAAAPDAHSAFAGWSVTGAEPCPGTGTCSVLLSHNVEVGADFEEPTQQSLEVSLSGAGSVTSSPAGLACSSGTCSEHFNQGRIVTLTATPAAHQRFAGWSGVACDESTAATCQVTMNHAESLTARFAPAPQQTLTLAVGGSGEGLIKSSPAGISCPPSCAEHFDEGSTVALAATPTPGSSFAGFSGGGCSGTGPCEVTMSEAQSVRAEFAPLDPPPPVKIPTDPPLPPSAAPNAAPSPRAASLSLRRLAARGTVALSATVSDPGTLSASGKGLKDATAHPVAGAVVTLHLALNAAGRRALARAKHGKLTVKVTVTFTPSDGAAPVAATKTVTFKAKNRGH